jgi:AraC-like DNA-binding protein
MVALFYEPDRVYYRFALDGADGPDDDASSDSATSGHAATGQIPPLRARHLDAEGDTSLWLEPHPEKPRENPPGDDASRGVEAAAIWPRLLAPVDAAAYLLQHQLGRYLETCRTAASSPDIDRPLVESAAALVVARTLRGAARQLPAGGPARSGRALEREAAAGEALRRQLARQRAGDASLRQAVERAGASKTHVNRALRAHLGWSPHRYGLELRLRRALVRWGAPAAEAPETLADLARELGFSSHSHLTARFRQVFGVVPSWLREGTAEERLRWLSGAHAQPAGSGSAQDESSG